jgi:hypothetical protein
LPFASAHNFCKRAAKVVIFFYITKTFLKKIAFIFAKMQKCAVVAACGVIMLAHKARKSSKKIAFTHFVETLQTTSLQSA